MNLERIIIILIFVVAFALLAVACQSMAAEKKAEVRANCSWLYNGQQPETDNCVFWYTGD